MSIKILSDFIKFAEVFGIEVTTENLKKFRMLQKLEIK